MPHRPFTRAQALENARFLSALARTGNARLAAAELGVHRATYTRRRAHNPRFAALWDAALAFAHAALNSKEPAHLERSRGRSPSEVERPRAKGGEPLLLRLANGRVQLRRAPRGRMTKAAEQAFLSALAATCNVRLAAAAAGFTHSAFYQRARKDPGFAREWRLARAEGHQRLKCALIAATLPASHEDDAWRHNDPLPIPPMSADQAIQLLCLHDKAVEQSWSQPHRRRRRRESDETYYMRLRAMWVSEQNRAAELRLVAEAARNEPDFGEEDGEGIAALPALEQVAGWSGADPATKVHDPDVALFGGWRIQDWKRRKR
jgi:hypothetical protein